VCRLAELIDENLRTQLEPARLQGILSHDVSCECFIALDEFLPASKVMKHFGQKAFICCSILIIRFANDKIGTWEFCGFGDLCIHGMGFRAFD